MIRVALAIPCFVFGGLLLAGVSAWAANSLTWTILGNEHVEAAKVGAIAVAVLAVALLLCFPLARRFVRRQRARPRRTRIAAWAGATAVVAPLALLAAVMALVGGLAAADVHDCERAVFPLLACHDWHEECLRAGDCRFKPYWQAKRRGVVNRQPRSLFDEFEIAMYKRHVAAGWWDAANPEHVRAVDAEWGRALEAHRRRGLPPDPDTLGEP